MIAQIRGFCKISESAAVFLKPNALKIKGVTL